MGDGLGESRSGAEGRGSDAQIPSPEVPHGTPPSLWLCSCPKSFQPRSLRQAEGYPFRRYCQLLTKREMIKTQVSVILSQGCPAFWLLWATREEECVVLGPTLNPLQHVTTHTHTEKSRNVLTKFIEGAVLSHPRPQAESRISVGLPQSPPTTTEQAEHELRAM